MKSIIRIFAAVFVFSVFMTSCESQWDSHIEAKELRGKTLMQLISEDPQTSTFATILQKTGYDLLLSGDKMLTVFAPVNDALTNVDMNNVASLTELVKNHIAWSNFTVENGSFNTPLVEMINTKSSVITGLQIDGIGLVQQGYNYSLKNGVLHKVNGVIPVKKNIWEYLQTKTGNIQAAYIQAHDRFIMDMEKSIQIGVQAGTGKPLYDTVWINENPFLKAYPINDESKRFTFALLPNDVVTTLETKYAKYFAKESPELQDSIVRGELISDCILVPVEISADGRYMSVEGVLMDISAANITETYRASNGTVYSLSNANVKIYENKVKTILIQGENYDALYSNNANSWMKRFRPALFGGQDMVLNSGTYFAENYPFKIDDSINDTTMNISFSSTFYPNSTSNVGNVNNCYLEFRPVLNSVAYKMYWSAYDDYPGHINVPMTRSVAYKNKLNRDTTVTLRTTITARFSQKLLISLPDQPKVTRKISDGTISNNFATNSVFTSSRFTAGVKEEKQLMRSVIYTDAAATPSYIGFVMPVRNATPTSDDDYFVNYTGSDKYGDKETIISPNFGEATLMVANTTETKAASSGMIFLDYIKLVPVVDPNE